MQIEETETRTEHYCCKQTALPGTNRSESEIIAHEVADVGFLSHYLGDP